MEFGLNQSKKMNKGESNCQSIVNSGKRTHSNQKKNLFIPGSQLTKFCPILELLPTANNNFGNKSTTIERKQEDGEKVLSFAHIAEENFLLILMLTDKANLAIYYATNCGGTSSRCEKVQLGHLFPKQKLLNSHQQPILVALTDDASAVCLVSADSNTIFLMPFSSLLDVTWGRSSAPLAKKPTMFSILDFEEQEKHFEGTHENLPTCAICFRSRKAERTYLLFGNGNGALFLVDLHIKRLSIRIELKAGIKSLSICADCDSAADDEQKYLLINLCDSTQIVLPLETQTMQIRERFARIGAKDVHILDENVNYFPQKENNSICVLEKNSGTLRIYNSCSFNNAQSKFVQLDKVPTKNVQQLLITAHFVAILTSQNQIFLHFRFLQSNNECSTFSPIQLEEAGKIGGNYFGILPAINSFNIDTQQYHHNQHKQCSNSASDILLIVTETGLYRLNAEKSLDGFILDHLNAQQNYSTDCLAKIAASLGPTISPLQLCLSLLRTILSAGMRTDENQQAQIHGLLSIALSNNVELELLLKLLQEYGQTNLLIPFLCLKCERNPSDLGMRRLLLTAMLTKISNLTQNLGSNGGNVAVNSNNLEDKEKAKLELEGMELELRNFLSKFGTCDQNIMPILLRAHFWQCIFVLLSRDPKEHSPALARHLLEMPTWKCVPRLDGMLLCISFLHWPTMVTFTPTLLVKLLNLVPTLNAAQLRRVAQIADTLLTKMSMESALPLKLIVSMRLYGLEALNKKAEIVDETNPIEAQKAAAYVPIACGQNCTVALVENAFEYGKEEGQNDGQNRPMFWGEFVAGTSRMVNNNGEKAPTAKRGVNESKNRGEEMPSIRRRRKEESNFSLAPIPIVLDSDEIKGIKICCVAAGTEHVLLLSTDGRIFSFGRNRFGQCGNGNNLGQPKLFEIHGNWLQPLQINAGHYHSAMITQNNEVWLWGWGLYGQLGNGKINDCFLPTKSQGFSRIGSIKQICLGYAHTLALSEDGRVFGCGATSNGQLGIDPARLPQNPQKICQPIQIQFPPAVGPIVELASAYFHGLALTKDGDLFEWGECPQSLKMRMFLQKRLRAKQKEKEQQEMRAVDQARKDEEKRLQKIGQKSCSSTQNVEKHLEINEDDDEEEETNVDIAADADYANSSTKQSSSVNKRSSQPQMNVTAGQSPAALMPIEMPKHHLRIRRICKLSGAPIKMLTAGFNHSALLTTNGEIFTWGKSLEMQLGHGDRKEKTQPTRLEGDQKWQNVICARNFTVALSAEGLIYIWGRNDRNQLGLGIAQMKPIRKILLKSEKGKAQKTVELPADNCVEKPSILTGLKVAMKEEEASIPNEKQLQLLISTADQLSINSLSRFLTRYPLATFIAVQAHLMAGDLLSAIRTLAQQQKEELISNKEILEENTPKENVERQISVISKISPSSKNEQQQQIRRGIPPQTRIGTIKLSSGNIGNESSMAQTSTRRVAVQMKKTYCSNVGTSTTQNSGKIMEMMMAPSTSGSSSNRPPTHDSISPESRNGQALRKMSKSSPEKNPSSSSSAAIDSTNKTSPSGNIEHQSKLTASSPPTISIADTSNSATTNKSMEKFYSMVDRIWNLLRIHPIREVQTLALLELLNGQFPVYNRLAADLRFCRLIDNFIEFPSSTNSNDLLALTTGQKRFFELSVRERQIALKKAIVDVGSRRFQSLKHRCEQILAQDRFRYFNDCGHFEKCIVESGPSQSEMANLRNRMRQCTRCCTNWIGARRRSAESSQRMAVANPQKSTAGHAQSPASL